MRPNTATPLAMRLHLLPTHSLSVLAHLQVRSIPDLLPVPPHIMSTNDQSPHMLNHPPVLLVRDGGGEEVLNIDCVKIQLNIVDDKSLPNEPVPGRLFVYVIDASNTNISTRTLNFIFGDLQRLHYRKTEAAGETVDLQRAVIETFVSDKELNTSIARDIFNRTSLASRHHMKLFAATRLKAKRLSNLIKEAYQKMGIVSHETSTPSKGASKTKSSRTKKQSKNTPPRHVGCVDHTSTPVRHHSQEKKLTPSTKTNKTAGSNAAGGSPATEHQMPINFDEPSQ